jgi:hypothetical protein
MIAPGDKVVYYETKDILAKRILPDSEKKTNIIEMIMATTGVPNGQIADRTETFLGRYKTVHRPIPAIPNSFTKTFAEISIERAQQIIDMDKEIVIAYSGGIDSTFVLVQFLKLLNNTSRIKLIMNNNSIEENPEFYNNYIKDKINNVVSNDYHARFVPNSSQVLITGDQIPQLFGQSLSVFMSNRSSDWRPFVLKNFDDLVKARWFMETIQPWLNKAPFEINSIYDWIWWVSFSMRWDNGRCRPLKWNVSYDKDVYENNVISFFRTDDYQLWSIFNHDKKIKTTPESFKYIMKDGIFEFDGNEDYRDNKLTRWSNAEGLALDSILTNKPFLINNDRLPVLVDENINYYFKSDIINNASSFTKLLNPTDNNEWYDSNQ